MAFLWGLAGVFLLLAIALLFSVDRRKIRLRTVGVALLVQVIFGALVLYWPLGQRALQGASDAVQMVIDSANAGIEFVFGPLLESGFTFAIQVLPVIIFVASLTSVLYYLGILQWVVKIVGGAFAKLFGTTTAESMNTAANIFLGHTEAPLLIKPYLKRLTQSELFAVMTGGMATVAGSVLVGYALMGVPLEFLIAAAFMAAPGALVMAKILMPAGAELPEREGGGRLTEFIARYRTREAVPATAGGSGTTRDATTGTTAGGSGTSTGATTTADDTEGENEDQEENRAVNVVDAAARGAGEGLQLVLNIAAMLIAFIGLIALVNVLLGGVGGWFGYSDLTMQSILGWILAPVMFVIGVPWAEAAASGSFVGQKIVLNEFVAFSEFGPVVDDFSAKTQAIVTFALTGFANFAAIAMQIGALGSLAPNQRTRIAQLGMRAVLAGTLANLMSATIAGVMVTL